MKILITGGAGFIGSALRPQNTTLSKEKIKNHFSLKIPLWQKSLKECLKEIT